MNWKLQSVDITCAFLQGNTINREVYLQLPKDIRKEGIVWKLKRSIYGLNDAPRAWYDKVRSEMKRFGVTVSKFDKAVFMWHENDKLIGLLVSHVDDFSFAGIDAWEQCILKKIKTSFSISLHQTDSFKVLGFDSEAREHDYSGSIYSDHHSHKY